MNPPTISINSRFIVFDGQLGRLKEHRHAVIALLVGLERDFLISTAEQGERLVRFSLIPADVKHRLDFFGSRALVVYIEPHERAYAALHRTAQGKCLDLAQLPTDLVDSLESWSSKFDPWPFLVRVGVHFSTDQKPLDERINHLTHLWNEGEFLDAEVDTLAQAVSLSPSRLLHLFKAELGVGVRRLKQHYRFKIATETVARGGSLTLAAHQAGFADSSHLSRAFLQTFGLAPTQVLGAPVQWIAGESR